jgi:hypothetical protein
MSLHHSFNSNGEPPLSSKANVTLPATVEKIVKSPIPGLPSPIPGLPEKAQIAVQGGDDIPRDPHREQTDGQKR